MFRLRLILAVLCFASSAAMAADEKGWYLANSVADSGPGMAGLCSGSFNLVIKQPQELEDCDGFFDVLFYADLKTRRVYWSKSAAQKVDASDYKRSVVAVLGNQLQSGGAQTLEQMREFYFPPGQESAMTKVDGKASKVTEKATEEKQQSEGEQKNSRRVEAPAVGACRVGDELAFMGGWIVGAAGSFPLGNPVAVMERLQDGSARDRQKIAEDAPMRFRWHGRGVGCEGVSQAKPMPVYLSEPLGGGTVKGGRFVVVTADVRGDNGRKGACYLLVSTKDVQCQR